MRSANGLLQISAADLSNHLACRHLTRLDMAAVDGRLAPPVRRSGEVEMLRERGLIHELAYLKYLSSQGLGIADLGLAEENPAHTLEAMREGADVIYQAPLGNGRWHGRADILRRVDTPSDLGPWSYEAHDTKLARETRGGTVLQLCLYSDFLRELQGVLPLHMHVVPPGNEFKAESFKVNEYMAYYRLARRRLELALDQVGGDLDATPDPVSHCEVCRWWPRCDSHRRKVDHLSFVAGISRLQMKELRDRGVNTLTDLASHPIPLEWRPKRGSAEGYVRVREQARVQHEARSQAGEPIHELLLPTEQGRGLARLPEPSQGDVFLDLEGDPFVTGGSLEYLFGFTAQDEPYWHAWALDRSQERAAFERVVDAIMQRWERDPGMHVYHFAPYEPTALTRLTGRYATRDSEINRMLRAGLFVDLHSVVRQALRASVESYSLKDLEVFHAFDRNEDLDKSKESRRMVERAIEIGPLDLLTDAVRKSVERYNREDCVSAAKLRDWLETLRAQAVANGEEIPRPVPESGDPTESVAERERKTTEMMEVLLEGIPDDPAHRTQEQQALWLLANLLDWHRREENAAWREYFRLRGLSEQDLLDERKAIVGLEFVGREGGTEKCPIHRYRFAKQETSIREDAKLHSGEMEGIGTVEAIDIAGQTVDIKKTAKAAGHHPASVFAAEVFPNREAANSLFRLAEWIVENPIDGDGPRRAARDLLLRRSPRFADGDVSHPTGMPSPAPGEDSVAFARRLVTRLDRSVLPIQGPPGSGKTYAGARMIVELARAGKKVGVSATSHKVIRNLLDAALRAAADEGFPLACAQKPKEVSEDAPAGLFETTDNDEAVEAITGRSAHVLGGTAWMWSREQFFESVDVLIVDEAGQMSLADVLAIAQAADSVVLLGDPQQLDQPIQGSHPDGTEISALQYLIGDARTITPDRGIFLAETRRLAPPLCEFTSEVFYEGRLRPMDGLERQALVGDTPFVGAGLWFVPVEHEGNRNASAEEVDAVGALVHALTSGGVRWVNEDGVERPLGLEDVLVVAPYNAQVADLLSRLPGARVGTVDKFQGQEAAVVIYSLTASTVEDAPRGMEFLYDLNRLNVATSRARCACIVVGSPRIFEPDCQTPRQMQLANALCMVSEHAACSSFEHLPRMPVE